MWFELILLAVILITYFVLRDRKPPNMPPGPFEIPFLGGPPLFEEKFAMDLKNKYGDICTIRTGSLRSVVIFDYKLGKEVLSRQEMAGRPSFFSAFSLDEEGNGGVLGNQGPQWQHDRRFVLRNLRNLGMGKSFLEEAINTEAQALVEDLKSYNGQPIHYPDSFRTAVLNIVWQMVASRRYDLHSEEVDSIYKFTKEFQSQPVYTLIPLFFPSMNKFMPRIIMDKVFRDDIFRNFLAEMKKLVGDTIDQHEKDGDLDNPKDLIDEYLREMRDREEEGNNEFCRKGSLMQTVNDLFGAGSDTVNNMLKWTAWLLARYPEEAKKLHEQIDSVVPRNRLVSLDDKPHLPYVEAFIHESLRFSSMIIMNVQRTAMQDSIISGYRIPKDTIISVCNYACHYDTRYWDEPEVFNPSRFLTDDGKFKAPKEGFIAFGQGRRQCLGESLARMEYFLFTAAIAQNFDVLVPEGVTLDDKVENRMGLRVPHDRTLIYRTRK